MTRVKSIKLSIICGAVLGVSIVCSTAFAQSPTPVPQDQERGQTSYMKVDITEPFSTIMARMTAAKPGIEKEHTDLLNERYDLSNRPAQGVTMERGKPLQEGVRVKLPAGLTWERLAAMSPDEIREHDLSARRQGQPALPARRASADAGGHGRVLQPDTQHETCAAGKAGSGGIPAHPLAGMKSHRRWAKGDRPIQIVDVLWGPFLQCGRVEACQRSNVAGVSSGVDQR